MPWNVDQQLAGEVNTEDRTACKLERTDATNRVTVSLYIHIYIYIHVVTGIVGSTRVMVADGGGHGGSPASLSPVGPGMHACRAEE